MAGALNTATLAVILQTQQFEASAKKAEAAISQVATTAETSQARITRAFAVRETSGLRAVQRAAIQEQQIVKQQIDWRISAQRQAADLREFIARREAAAAVTALNSTTAATVAVGTATGKTSLRVGELRESLASLAARVSGVHPIMGRFTNVLGGLALGSAPMVAVLAGIAALGAAYRKLTEDTRKAKEEQQKFNDKMADLAREQRITAAGGESAVDYRRASREYEEAEARVFKLARAQRELQASFQAANMSAQWWAELARRAKRADEELTVATNNLAAAKKRLAEEEGAVGLEMNRTAVGIIRDATRDAERETDRRIQAARRAAEEEIRLMREVEAERQRIANYRLSLARNGVRTNPLGVSGGGLVYGPAMPLSLAGEAAAAKGNADAAAAAKVMEQIWEEAIRGIQQSFARGFEAIFDNGVRGFRDFADAVASVFKGIAAQIAAAMTSRALGLDKALNALKSGGSGGYGAAAQVGAAAAAAGAIGMLAGAIVDAGNAAREAARRQREYELSLRTRAGEALAGYRSSVQGPGSEAFQAWVAYEEVVNALNIALRDGKMSAAEYAAGIVEANSLYVLSLDNIKQATDAAAQAEAQLAEERRLADQEAAREAEAEKRVRSDNLQHRLALAQGDELGARLIARTIELNAARDDEERAMLRQIYAAEDLADARAEEIAAALAAADAALEAANALWEMEQSAAAIAAGQFGAGWGPDSSFTNDTNRRRIALVEGRGGRTEDSIRAAWQIRYNSEMAEANDLFSRGLININELLAREALLYDELELELAEYRDSIEKLRVETERAAAELAKLNVEVSKDLDVREMRAKGDLYGADLQEFMNNQAREVDKARAAGWTPENIERLLNLQKDELRNFITELDSKYKTGSAAVDAIKAESEVVRSVRGISETTAVRMADLTMTSNIWLREIAVNTRGLRGTDGAAYPTAVGGRASGIVVNINGNITATDPKAAATTIATTALNRISVGLANLSQGNSRASGDASV